MPKVISRRAFTIHRNNRSTTMLVISDRRRIRASRMIWMWLKISSSAMHRRHTRVTRKLRNRLIFENVFRIATWTLNLNLNLYKKKIFLFSIFLIHILSLRLKFRSFITALKSRLSPTPSWLSMRSRTRASWRFPASISGSREYIFLHINNNNNNNQFNMLIFVYSERS